MSKPTLDIDAALARAEAKPDGAAARLLDAALEEFAAGMAAARTQSIAARAGVSVGSLHFHWRDKETLYEAVCRRGSRRYGAMLTAALTETVGGGGVPDGEVLIDRWVEASVALFAEKPALVKLLVHRFADDAPRSDRETHLADLRLMQQTLHLIFPRVARGEVDAPMTILFVYFATLVMFSGSDVQRAYLGVASDSHAFRARFVAYCRTLLRTALL